MGGLDIDSLFTKISLEKTIEICTNNLFKNSNIVRGLKKGEFKHILFLPSKKSYVIFNNILYKQIDGVAIESPLGSSLSNAFMGHHEQNWVDSCSLEYRPSYYQRYVNDTFVVFKPTDYLIRFQSHLNYFHVNMSFTIENEQIIEISFQDVNVFRKQGKFTIKCLSKTIFQCCMHPF